MSALCSGVCRMSAALTAVALSVGLHAPGATGPDSIALTASEPGGIERAAFPLTDLRNRGGRVDQHDQLIDLHRLMGTRNEHRGVDRLGRRRRGAGESGDRESCESGFRRNCSATYRSRSRTPTQWRV